MEKYTKMSESQDLNDFLTRNTGLELIIDGDY